MYEYVEPVSSKVLEVKWLVVRLRARVAEGPSSVLTARFVGERATLS